MAKIHRSKLDEKYLIVEQWKILTLAFTYEEPLARITSSLLKIQEESPKKSLHFGCLPQEYSSIHTYMYSSLD